MRPGRRNGGHERFPSRYYATSQEVFDYIAWRRSGNPLILSVGIPEIRADADEACDLLIVGERLPEQSRDAYEKLPGEDFWGSSGRIAGSTGCHCGAAGPLGRTTPRGRHRTTLGVAFQAWHAETPRQSRATDHPLGGLPRGLGRRGDNAHITYDWHMEVAAPAATVAARLASGAPDIVLQDRACFIGSNLFADLIWHGRHPDYWSYEGNVSALLVDIVRAVLGLELAESPPAARTTISRV